MPKPKKQSTNRVTTKRPARKASATKAGTHAETQGGSRFFPEPVPPGASGSEAWSQLVNLLLSADSVEVVRRGDQFELRRWESFRRDGSNAIDADPGHTY